jgi:hypothetical protein
MRNLPRSLVILPLVFLGASGCSPSLTSHQLESPSGAPLPTDTLRPLQPTPSVQDMIELVYVSDPSLPQYDPTSAAYGAFPQIVTDLSTMGLDAMDAVSHLAVAIRFPRQDSYLAAQALLQLGPDITVVTIPILLDNLRHPRADVRIYSLVLLASAGPKASCAVGGIGPLLWDSDPSVRTSAALALDKILENDLLSAQSEPLITPSFVAASVAPDLPEESVVADARSWWLQDGSTTNWHPTYGICDP